jgi:CRISPR system Cascade subunit CasE
MTAWLTRIQLNTRHSAVRADLRDAASLHRRLMSLLPDDLGDRAREAAALLFRLEEIRSNVQILAQSTLRLDLEHLPQGYGESADRSLAPLLTALTVNDIVHYRLAANASKRVWKGDEHHHSGQVVALTGEAADMWWAERASRSGLALLSASSRPQPTINGVRSGSTVRHGLIRFDGTARVENPDILRSALLGGIGRGKSYGCGLLSIAPAPQP